MILKHLAAAAVLTVFCSTHASAADKLTLLLDWFVNPDHGPVIIAQEKGYFAQAGLEVEIIEPADPSDPPKLVAAGKADLAVSYQPQLHLQVEQELPLVRVGTLVATPLTCLLVLADGPVKTLADLKDRKVGFSVAGVEQAMLGAMLKPHKLTNKDIELVNVNFSLSPALMSGQVDAVFGAFRNFELNQMKIEGVAGRCFYPEEEGIPPYDELIYVANANNIDKAVLKRFIDATERATQYIVNHPLESWKIFSATKKELQDELNRLAWTDTIPRFALRPAALDTGRYERMAEFMKQSGLVTRSIPLKQYAIDISAP
ncbi:MAG: ABC transporter substrate-binding protein [Burkholderiaceae bacterium]